MELGCPKNTLSALHDQLGRDYLYTANNQGGFSVLDISDPENMVSIVNLPGEDFGDIKVNRVTQDGHYLYLALGSSFGSHDEPSGLAIIDVMEPTDPTITDIWTTVEDGGATHIAVEGDLAYLCGLGNGVIVLNISDKENISFVSQYIPPLGWPEGTEEAQTKARQIVLDGTKAYLTYGGGGLRVLDISNPEALNEIGRYSNPALDNAARAYNNMVQKENLLYVAVDYVGMEILDISDIEDISLIGWWNPNDLPYASPAATSARWFTSPWHTNEIEMIDECGIVFMSCGRTDVVGIDVSDPYAPELCGSFGDSTDNVVSYGLGIWGNRIYVGMICTFGAPFSGIWSGVKSFVYDSDCPLGMEEETIESDNLSLYPNPTSGLVYFNDSYIKAVAIYNLEGKVVIPSTTLSSGANSVDLSGLKNGLYLVWLTDHSGKTYVNKISLNQ